MRCSVDVGGGGSVGGRGGVGSLRRGEGGPERFLRSLGRGVGAWCRGGLGGGVWGPVRGGSGCRRMRFSASAIGLSRRWAGWRSRVGGQVSADHPLLGAVVAWLVVRVVVHGRLSLESHPWLADHVGDGCGVVAGYGVFGVGVACG